MNLQSGACLVTQGTLRLFVVRRATSVRSACDMSLLFPPLSLAKVSTHSYVVQQLIHFPFLELTDMDARYTYSLENRVDQRTTDETRLLLILLFSERSFQFAVSELLLLPPLLLVLACTHSVCLNHRTPAFNIKVALRYLFHFLWARPQLVRAARGGAPYHRQRVRAYANAVSGLGQRVVSNLSTQPAAEQRMTSALSDITNSSRAIRVVVRHVWRSGDTPTIPKSLF